MYGGIHFSFDNDAGQQVGADVAEYVLEHWLVPQDTLARCPGAHGEVFPKCSPPAA
jgi:hypothetical protein